MIPLAQVWYTKPPKLSNASYYGTINDWNQTVAAILVNFVREGLERNFYNEGICEFLNIDKIHEPNMILICNPCREEFMNSLQQVSLSHVWTEYGQITIKYDNKFDLNKLLYRDWIYENEIVLIDEEHP